MVNSDWMPLLFCGLSIPISLFMWLGNVAFSIFWSSGYGGKVFFFQLFDNLIYFPSHGVFIFRTLCYSTDSLALFNPGPTHLDDCGSTPPFG